MCVYKVNNYKPLYSILKLWLVWKKVLANFVPAAAVKREGQALFKLTGRKAYVDWKLLSWLNVKINFKKFTKRIFWSLEQDCRILNVTVKCIDI